MNESQLRRSDRLRRVQAAIARDEEALRAAQERRDFGEIYRLTRDLANRRAYLAELLGPREPGS